MPNGQSNIGNPEKLST